MDTFVVQMKRAQTVYVTDGNVGDSVSPEFDGQGASLLISPDTTLLRSVPMLTLPFRPTGNYPSNIHKF